jgi:hypothetical protein
LFRYNPAFQKFHKVENRLAQKDSVFTPDVMDFLETTKVRYSSAHGAVEYLHTIITFLRSGQKQVSNLENGKSDMPWCMIQRTNGDIWMGIQLGGIYIIKNGVSQFSRPAEFKGSTVRQLAIDKKW